MFGEMSHASKLFKKINEIGILALTSSTPIQ